jgi:hypothetical protein
MGEFCIPHLATIDLLADGFAGDLAGDLTGDLAGGRLLSSPTAESPKEKLWHSQLRTLTSS